MAKSSACSGADQLACKVFLYARITIVRASVESWWNAANRNVLAEARELFTLRLPFMRSRSMRLLDTENRLVFATVGVLMVKD